MSFEYTSFHGQPAVEFQLPQGDRALVLLHGAHLVSWRTADEVEHLYLSPESEWDGQHAVRGGVPICFPQFNQRGPLIKHGFVRNLPWQVAELDGGCVTMVLRDGPLTRAFWAERFEARLTLRLTSNQLSIKLQVLNTGDRSWPFTAALHSYLRVDDVERIALQGLQGAACWDALRDTHSVQQQDPVFGVEFDRVYQAPDQPLVLDTGGGARLTVAQSASCAQTVVWNPGPELAGRLSDLPDAGWRQMLCVEAACIDQPVHLAPAQSWEGWQQLSWQP